MSDPGSQKHILAINNNKDVLNLFTELLGDEGYRVSTQVYVDHDLKGIAELSPDLIIIDYMWADEDDGWSLLQMIRMNRATAKIPIILCTGAIREAKESEDHLLSMKVDVIYKPFEIDPLLELIARALAGQTPAS